MKLVNRKQMQSLEKKATSGIGITEVQLMERAGIGIADFLLNEAKLTTKDFVLILAGSGNNGGDAMVVARELFNKKIPLVVVSLGIPKKTKKELLLQQDILEKLEVPVFFIESGSDMLELETYLIQSIKKATWIVDGVFGYGLNKPVEDYVASIFELLEIYQTNECKIVAIDVPSGLDCDSGEVLGQAINADYTLSLGLAKTGLYFNQGPNYAGIIKVIDIGIPPKLVESQESEYILIDWSKAHSMLPKPKLKDSHKNTYGPLSIVGGSKGMIGAPHLAIKAGFLSGAGFVRTFAPPEMIEPLSTISPESVYHELRWDDDTSAILHNSKAIAIGMGLDNHPNADEFIYNVLQNITNVPIVLDGYGLSFLAKNKKTLRPLDNVILTPHPKEACHLLHWDINKVLNDRQSASEAIAAKYNCTVLLKGQYTIVEDKNKSYLNCTVGNPILATAGTGDILSGIIGGLLCRGLSPIDAAGLGAYIHGLCGDIAKEELHTENISAGQLIPYITKAISAISVNNPS